MTNNFVKELFSSIICFDGVGEGKDGVDDVAINHNDDDSLLVYLDGILHQVSHLLDPLLLTNLAKANFNFSMFNYNRF